MTVISIDGTRAMTIFARVFCRRTKILNHMPFLGF